MASRVPTETDQHPYNAAAIGSSEVTGAHRLLAAERRATRQLVGKSSGVETEAIVEISRCTIL